MFVDVRGFTALSERVSPDELVRRLNRFYAIATEVVIELDGTLDKFVGDQVMAFFGAPFQQRGHAQRAVQAAHAIVAGTMSMGESDPLAVGGGVATGEALVGNVAGGDVRDFTALGDTVNVAARLQGAAQAGEILLTEESYQAVSRLYPDAPLRRLELKGKSAPVIARVIAIERPGDLVAESRATDGAARLRLPAPVGDPELLPAAAGSEETSDPPTGSLRAALTAAGASFAGSPFPPTLAPASTVPPIEAAVEAARPAVGRHRGTAALTGRAAIFRGPRRPFEIQEAPVPDPEPGAAIIAVSLTGVGASDLALWRGHLAEGYPPVEDGQVFGQEMTGRIAALGDDLTTDSIGRPLAVRDRVVHCPFTPCGRCRACQRGDRYACPHQDRRSRPRDVPSPFATAYGDYLYLHPGAVIYKLPDDLPDDLAASVNGALSRTLFGWQHLGLKPGDRALIHGADRPGLYAAATAKALGAGCVIVIDRLSQRLDLARRFGADATINVDRYRSREERAGIVRELTDGVGADLAADLTGRPEAVEEGLALTRDGGGYLLFGGIVPGPPAAIDSASLARRGQRIVAIARHDPAVLPDAIEFVCRHRDRVPFDALVTHTYPLSEIDQAFRRADQLDKDEGNAFARTAVRPGE